VPANDVYKLVGDDVVELAVHAQPGAGRTHVVGRHGDALKVRVAAPPEQGRANDALARLLAEAFGVTTGDVQLVTGATSRQKRFRITGVDPAAVPQRVDDLLDGYPAAPSRRTPRTH
jgi:uncharacterized protein (TIGR00251 family)